MHIYEDPAHWTTDSIAKHLPKEGPTKLHVAVYSVSFYDRASKV